MSLIKGEAGVAICLEDLCHRVDVCGGSQVQTQVVRDGCVHDGTGSALHGVVQTRVDNVLLRGSRHSSVEFGRRGDRNSASDAAKPSLEGVLDGLQEVIVGLTLIFEGETAVGNVVEILQPLKVGDSDTTGIDVHVRDDLEIIEKFK